MHLKQFSGQIKLAIEPREGKGLAQCDSGHPELSWGNKSAALGNPRPECWFTFTAHRAGFVPPKACARTQRAPVVGLCSSYFRHWEHLHPCWRIAHSGLWSVAEALGLYQPGEASPKWKKKPRGGPLGMLVKDTL